jgi:predicted dinucleotide-binding enzyme
VSEKYCILVLGKPIGTPGRTALPVADDDALAKAVVIELIDQIGFDAVDAGGLDDSWQLQMGTPISGHSDLDIEGVQKALAAASPERPAEWRA